ncbi:hypothetical protein ABZY93_22325 [Streptomyces smyrnaeus]|uniref:hypothetical protein n=1 Tax=Streptomyces smyrnaeus TaxID=1387713 RepID=UPI0033A7A3CB
MKMSIEDAKRAVVAIVGDSNAVNRALDDLVTAVRSEGVGLIHSLKPKEPCEEEEPIVWVLDLAAEFVERGRR